jgi:SAM-dependent methyltransferase
MSIAPEWDVVYRRGGQAIRWPWSDVVSLVTRHVMPLGPGVRVLELGCGSGANIPFFKASRCEYYSVEGSAVVLPKVRAAHPDLADRIVPGDFTLDLPVPGEFDVIVDRAALAGNATEAIRRALSLVYRKLKPAGLFIGVDWYSVRHPDYQRGEPGADANTRTGYLDGVFAGVGPVHFSDEDHLRHLFESFELVRLDHKTLEAHIPEEGWTIATWNIVARKVAR